MTTKRPKEFLTPTPQEVLNAITLWQSMHGAPNGQITRVVTMEREFTTAFGGSFGTVSVNQLPQAIDLLCNIIANMERFSFRTATERLELIMEHLVTTIGKGSGRAGLADAEALTSALQLARQDPNFPYTYGWGSRDD